MLLGARNLSLRPTLQHSRAPRTGLRITHDFFDARQQLIDVFSRFRVGIARGGPQIDPLFGPLADFHYMAKILRFAVLDTHQIDCRGGQSDRAQHQVARGAEQQLQAAESRPT